MIKTLKATITLDQLSDLISNSDFCESEELPGVGVTHLITKDKEKIMILPSPNEGLFYHLICS